MILIHSSLSGLKLSPSVFKAKKETERERVSLKIKVTLMQFRDIMYLGTLLLLLNGSNIIEH